MMTQVSLIIAVDDDAWGNKIFLRSTQLPSTAVIRYNSGYPIGAMNAAGSRAGPADVVSMFDMKRFVLLLQASSRGKDMDGRVGERGKRVGWLE